MSNYGVNIKSTGGETADVGDLVRTIIVDSTVIARIKKTDIIDNARISNGDVIVGLESFGKSNYESHYNLLRTATNDVTSSGILVPTETTVIPIILSLIPKESASIIAPSINHSEP